MKSILKLKLLIGLVFVISCNSSSDKVFLESDIQIIPKPNNLTLHEGNFEINKKTVFVVENEVQQQIAAVLVEKFQKATALDLEIVIGESTKDNAIVFVTDESLEKEAYKMAVTNTGISISSNGLRGFNYGLQSLRQLLPVEIESEELQEDTEWVIPQILIQDQPRYKWRGLMLDVSRHFFEKDYILEVIDGLAFHKMNILHLHLVDDQGWRIEIKKYPKLTSVGGFRVDQEDKHWSGREPNKPEDKGTFGGFYTQDEIREIVAYAASKGIDVVPEIELPAHVMSAIASYPELSCFENPIGVPSGGVWPITEIYCAGKESTFEFLENVFIEVMDLFPSKYIHVGGDEATKTNWAKCPHCQKRMKDEGLHDVEELQSYFIKRMEKFINSKGRKLIGWDEILEGGLAPDATVMSWRGVKGGIQASKEGHDVVMTPGTHCYFDHYQGPQNEEPLAWGGFLPLSKVYQFDPVVESMTEDQAAHILGGQANLWSEYIPTNEQSEYMIYPRLAALAETVWSNKNLRNWDDFSTRIIPMLARYEFQGINYAKSAFLVTANTQINMKEKTVEVLLKNEFPISDIRYTLDGSAVTANAKNYAAPIKLTETTTINASLFKENEPVGKPFSNTIKFHAGVAKKVSYVTDPNNRYQGVGDFNMVNTLRGSKNFHDGQWQAWLADDMELIIDLEKEMEISNVVVGSMENQGPGIYFPVEINVLTSLNGTDFTMAGTMKRPYEKNAGADLKDFSISFDKQEARYVKVIAKRYQRQNNGGVFIFIDEILIN